MKNNLLKKIFRNKNLYPILCLLVICFSFFFMPGPIRAEKSETVQIVKQNKITLKFKNTSLKTILVEIRKQTGYGIAFVNNGEINEDINILEINVKNASVENVMELLLKNTNYSYYIKNNTITVILKRTPPVSKIRMTVIGKVVDQNKKPIAGATAIVRGTNIGAITNESGTFVLVFTGEGIIDISYVGYVTAEYHAHKTVSDLTIQMKEDVMKMEDVIVSYGYYNVDKRKSTSAVTSLKGEDVLIPGRGTIDQMLEGKVPGMIFMQNSGQVGAAPKVKIRGTTTILGNQSPLWVVDGVILTDPVNVDPQQINDLDFVNLLGNAISGLNPEDIDQIDVLKDASATAIYGPKASNGVIVITTKKGKPGKPSVSYSGSATFRQHPRYTDKSVNVMNSQERIAYSRDIINKRLPMPAISSWVGYEAAYYDYYSGKITHDEFVRNVSAMESANHDWMGTLLNDTFSHNHTFSVSGGSSNIRFYASAGYMDENGNIKGENNKRYSVTSNLNLNYSKFSLQFGLKGNLQQKKYTPQAVGAADYAYNTARSVPAYNDDGSLRFYQRGSEGSSYDGAFNILNEIENSYNHINTSQISLNLDLKYNITSEFNIGATFSSTISNTDDETWYGEQSWYTLSLKKKYRDEDYFGIGAYDKTNSLCPTGGELNRETTRNESFSVRANATYNKFLDTDKNHNLILMAIGELSSGVYNRFALQRRGYLRDRGMGIDEYDLALHPEYAKWMQSPGARGIKKHNLTNQVGLIGSLSYSYKNTYIATANMRIDASNKFGDQSNKKLSPIWSISGRWNIDENLLKNAKWINELALKMSFGYQGNMSETESPRLILEQKGTDKYYEEFYSLIKYYPNPDLRWERTSTYNVGLDYSLFKNKLQGSFSYYHRLTKEAFMPKAVSAINGVEFYTVNSGTLENHGFEFTFNFTPVNNFSTSTGGDRKGFVWRFNPNFGTVINQLIDKVKPKDKILQDKVTYKDYLDGRVLVAGRPINTFYSYNFKGLNPGNGAAEFYNTEKSKMSEYDAMEMEEVFRSVMVRSGSREPFLQGSINNYFGWSDFALTLDIAYSVGSKIRLLRMYPNGGTPPSPEKNLRRELNNRWQNPGDELYTNVPGVLSEKDKKNADNPWWKDESYNFGANMWEMYDYSNVRVASGDYVKLQNVSFRYLIPEEFCRRLKIKSAYVSINGSNLFTICSKDLVGQDPTQSGSTALINISARPTYTLGVNLTF